MKFLVIRLSLLWIISTEARAQVEAIAATASVDSIVSKIRNALSELISEAEASATVVGFSVATDANILLQNLGILADRFTGKLFSELNATQQSALSNVLQVTKETNKDIKANLATFDAVIKEFGVEIARIPGVDDRPYVTSYSPSYILNDDAAYDVNIAGSLLNSKYSELWFGSTSCKLLSSVENQIRYRCPAEIFQSTENEWVVGTLSLHKAAPWYQFWKKDTKYEYRLSIMAIQEQMGRFSLTVFERRDTEKRITRSGSNKYKNGHCKSDKSRVWPYRPATGCKIDVSSIKVKPRTSSNSVYEGISNVSDHGFQVRGVIRNNGNCGPLGIPKDGRGMLQVSVTWVDICSGAKEEIALEPEIGDVFGKRKFLFSCQIARPSSS